STSSISIIQRLGKMRKIKAMREENVSHETTQKRRTPLHATYYATALTCKRLVRSSNDDRADLLVRVDQAQRLVQLCDQRHVERVECLGSVELHERDARRRARHQNVFVFRIKGRRGRGGGC